MPQTFMRDDPLPSDADDPLLNKLPPAWRGDVLKLRETLGEDGARGVLETAVALIDAAHMQLKSRNPSSEDLVRAAYLLSGRQYPR